MALNFLVCCSTPSIGLVLKNSNWMPSAHNYYVLKFEKKLPDL